MQHYGDVAKYVGAEQESLNLAQERYTIYLKSVEAAQNRLTSSWENLWQTSVNSGMITWWLNFASTMLDATSTMGGFNTILKIVIVNMIAFNAESIAASLKNFIAGITQGIASLQAMATAAQGAEISINAMFGVIGLAITAGILAWQAYQATVETTAEKLDRLSKEYDDLSNKLTKTKSDIYDMQGLVQRYNELASNTHRTTEEQQEFFKIQEQIRDIVPDVAGHFDEQGHFIIQNKAAVDALVQSLKDLRDQELAEMQTKAKERIETETEAFKKQNEELQKLIKLSETKTIGIHRDPEKEKQNIEDERKKIQETILAIKKDFYSLSQEQQKIQLDTLKGMGDWGKQIAQELENAQKIAMNASGSPDERGATATQGSTFGLPPSPDQEQYLGFLDTVNKLTSDRKDLLDIIDKAESGKLEYSDIKQLADAYPEYLNALKEENGQLTLNTDMVREYMASKAEAAVKSAELNGATQQEIDILKQYAQEMRGATETTITGISVSVGKFNELAHSMANNAALSGNSFKDLQGKALTSAQAIYDFMTKGNAEFNSFVQQAAAITGKSVQQIMSMINGMLGQTMNNAVSMINSLGGMVGGLSPDERDEKKNAPLNLSLFTPAPTGYQYPGGMNDYQSQQDKKKKDKEKKKQEQKQRQQEQERKLQQEIDAAKTKAEDSLRTQLKGYKTLIDARKDLLDTYKQERDYQDSIQDKNKDILKVQNELAALAYDNSEEAAARRAQLQDELDKMQKDLKNAEEDHSIQVQKDALDKQYTAFENQINSALDAIKNINAGSMADFTSQLAVILSGLSKGTAAVGTAPAPLTPAKFHDGGVVGNHGVLQSNEIFAKMLKGEVVSTPSQIETFMRQTLPALAQANNIQNGTSMGDINIPITIQGNVDKDTLPEMKKMIYETLNKIMLQRGINRRADAFSVG